MLKGISPVVSPDLLKTQAEIARCDLLDLPSRDVLLHNLGET